MSMYRTAPSISRRAFAAGLALVPFALSTAPRQAAGRQATPTAKKDVFRYTFGDAEVCLFDTDSVSLPVGLGAANATFAEQQAVTNDFGTIIMSNAVALVDTGAHLALLDSGPFARLTSRLENEGYRPEDIDVITFSHLHIDHIGGAFAPGGGLAFPNARYVVSKAEHDYWMNDDERPISGYAEPYIKSFRIGAQRFIASVRDRLDLVEWEEEILPGVRMIPAIGHTGGHGAVEIRSGEETLLHVGDLIVSPVLHLQHPEWYIAAAVWAEEDLASRRTLMDRAVEEHILVQTVHFPFPGIGYVKKEGDAWAWIPLA